MTGPKCGGHPGPLKCSLCHKKFDCAKHLREHYVAEHPNATAY